MAKKPYELPQLETLESDVSVAVDLKQEVREPPLFKVILHNDDFTTQEFVILVLQTIFHHPAEEAHRIMLTVHTRGHGIAGLYPHETAEAKVQRVTDLAKQSEYPLKCTMEPE